MAQALPELLRLQQERQIATDMGNQVDSGMPRQQTPQPQFQEQASLDQTQKPRSRESIFDVNQKLATQNQGITTKGPIAAALSDIREPTQQEFLAKRSELLKQSPWMSVAAAGEMANDYFRRENAQKTAQIEKGSRQEQVQQQFDKKFESDFNLLLNKPKNAISGDSYRDMRDAGREDVARGILTPDQAAKKYSNLALQIDENLNHVNEMAEKPLITQKPKTIVNNLKEGSKLWKDANRSKEYSNILQSKFKISPQLADSIALPIEDSKGIKSIVDDYKPTRPMGLTGLPDPSKLSQVAVKAARDVSKVKLDKDASINSMIVAFKNKDPYFDDGAFIEELRNLYNSGSLQLNPKQREEIINEQTSWVPNLYDWWMKISAKF
jgi:hypothetical protein